MKFSLRYHRSVLEGDLPDGMFRTVNPLLLPALPDPGARLREIFEQPVECPSFGRFLEGKRNLLLVLPDATRITGAEILSRPIIEYLNIYARFTGEIRVIIATGIHRAPTAGEVERLAGPYLQAGARLITHEPGSREKMADFGLTPAGNRILLHQSVEQAEAVLIIGGTGFHYFAGFSGGRKSLLPGIAHEDTIAFNHKLVFDPATGGRHPGVRTASLAGNPVHEDMLAGLQAAGPDKIFLINTMVDENGCLTGLIAGHPVASHLAACQDYLAAHSVRLDRPAGAVITSAGGYPRDINMIQSHKAIETGRYRLRPGGTMVVLAACSEGMGHPSFFPWFRFQEEAFFRDELIKNYAVNGQTALSLFEKTRQYRIIMVSLLPPDTVRTMGMEPAGSLAAALDLIRPELSPENPGLILPEGAITLCLTGEPA